MHCNDEDDESNSIQNYHLRFCPLGLLVCSTSIQRSYHSNKHAASPIISDVWYSSSWIVQDRPRGNLLLDRGHNRFCRKYQTKGYPSILFLGFHGILMTKQMTIALTFKCIFLGLIWDSFGHLHHMLFLLRLPFSCRIRFHQFCWSVSDDADDDADDDDDDGDENYDDNDHGGQWSWCCFWWRCF